MSGFLKDLKEKLSENSFFKWMKNPRPIELHLPYYNFCGPFTDIPKRIKRNDKPINKLDSLCFQHDLDYLNSRSKQDRIKADKILIDEAWKRVTAPDSNLKERIDSYLVTNAMKAKNKLGFGLDFNAMARKRASKNKSVAVRIAKPKRKRNKKNKNYRILEIPKIGGILSVKKNKKRKMKTKRRVSKKSQRKKCSAVYVKGRGLYLNPYKNSKNF